MAITRRSLPRHGGTIPALMMSLASLACFAAPAGGSETFDLVLKGGRVIDPEIGLDYGDLEIPETGGRLTKEKFDKLYGATASRLILIHANPDSIVD